MSDTPDAGIPQTNMPEALAKLFTHGAGGFSPLALEFVRDGLQHTTEMHHGVIEDPSEGGDEDTIDDESRHVSGRDLCLGLRDLAIRRYGPLARTVLEHWKIRSTHDFGRIVFALIEVGLLRKSDEDSIEDFAGVYDFDEAFAEAELI